MKRALTLIFLCASAIFAQAQSRTVYYFLDAMTTTKSATGSDKDAYIYSFPVVKTIESELRTDELVAAFRKEITEKYGVTSILSLVVRTNDNFDELRAHMSRSVDKFSQREYEVIKVENKD